jgi:hypothetical protein
MARFGGEAVAGSARALVSLRGSLMLWLGIDGSCIQFA